MYLNEKMKTVSAKSSTFLLFLFLFFTSFFSYAGAQTGTLFVKISPEVPGSYEDVTASVSGSSFNLDLASITWSLNGKKISSSIGQKEIPFKTGGIGEVITVTAVATLNGASAQGTATINPGEVDLLWQTTDIYTPPFYKGKALPSPESSIRITAVPNILRSTGVAYKTGDLSFKWSRDYEILGSLSGKGASTLTFKNDYLQKSERIGLET
jgi:hypothetical protein